LATVDIKKRALARRAGLDLEKRAQVRNAILHNLEPKTNSLEERAQARRAYMQGGPGPNDPKELGYPGEVKYPRMEVPVGGDSRQWEQNWFEGAAARDKVKFGPSGTELELKKKLQRASDALRGLDKTGVDAKKAAVKIANDLNEIVGDLDKAGYLEDAQEADSVLEQLVAYIAEAPSKKLGTTASVKKELVCLANELDGKGYLEEASEIDKILTEL
jgi:hypothetical protein